MRPKKCSKLSQATKIRIEEKEKESNDIYWLLTFYQVFYIQIDIITSIL